MLEHPLSATCDHERERQVVLEVSVKVPQQKKGLAAEDHLPREARNSVPGGPGERCAQGRDTGTK